MQRGLSVEPGRGGSSILNLGFTAGDPTFAQAAANAFAQAYQDVSVELRVAPARQSATFLDDQVKSLRGDLENAQARLSKFQQTKGIVVTDERLDQENARFNMLIAQLASAQAERVETETRQRNTGIETSPDVLGSGAVQGLKAQLAQAETKLSDISSIVGKNHPQRLQLDAQIAELKRQIAAETRRVAGGTSTLSRGSSQKVGELQTMVDQQKRQLLSLRSDRDQIAVYQRDVEAAQRAYDAVVDAARPGQHGRPEQPGQHAPAEPRGRAARAFAAEGHGRHRRFDPGRARGRHPGRARPRSSSTGASAGRRTSWSCRAFPSSAFSSQPARAGRCSGACS